MFESGLRTIKHCVKKKLPTEAAFFVSEIQLLPTYPTISTL